MTQAANLGALGTNVSSSGITQAAGGGTAGTAGVTGFKNRIINGGMAIWQRGTSITTGGAYTADRWNEVSGNSNQHIQSTDAPTGFAYSMQLIGVGANQNQRIESLNCQDLSGQTVTVSFWVKNTSGTDSLITALYYCNSADNFGSLTQIGSNVTISSNPSSTWTQYTATFSNLPANAKNGLSLYIARLGTGSVSTTWYLTGCQLEVGTAATNFDVRSYGTELALCQRYFCVTGATGDAFISTGFGAGTGNTFQGGSWPVSMRANPTVSYQGSFTGTIVTTAGIGGSINGFTGAIGSVNGWYAQISGTGTYPNYACVMVRGSTSFQLTGSAEL